MRRRILIAAVVGAAFPFFAAAAQSRSASADERAVLATVQRFFDAMRAKDTAGVRATFHPIAKLVGRRGDNVQILSVDDFVAFVGRDTRGPWIERAWNPEVRIDGTLAAVWAEYDFHFGQKPSHCGTDAVQLLLVGGEWKIMNIADTYRSSGCPARTPPSP